MKANNIKNYYKNKAYEKHKLKMLESSCKYGIFNNNYERAFHNCHNRAPNFKGYIFDFKEHIEKTFTDGMNWDNYGEWEIDHIIPLSKGGKHEIINLQALWKSDNRIKSNKIL